MFKAFSCNSVSISLIFKPVRKAVRSYVILEGQCAGSKVCPLTQIEAGTMVCIKQLAATPELSGRLRELGFVEQQTIKLLSRDPNVICQVCNARLCISEKLAESIFVEALPAAPEAGIAKP